MQRYICIHGHFYLPPRENAWLEAVELQDSAYPYHDWNERITAECYATNAASRILDSEDRIAQIVNNYARISFNFGPTLLAWMAERAPDVYQAILAADRESQTIFSGHGSALAQPYNHMIMPLANRRDKQTQVLWGVRDFEHRFARKPEGMWLPETAVDLETLEIMSEQGIAFTILAPHQAGRFRQLGDEEWHEANDGSIDPRMAYELHLPSGRKMSLFFYDGPTARAVAFEGLLSSGENFANRLISAFSQDATWPQLVHIATDGETYGHHHRFGDMALAYALQYIESNNLAQITNYGEYLEKHPPTHEVEIIENTSWSCYHGVERWRSDCGCNSGMHPGWNQAWRAPLREALNWLRDALAAFYGGKTLLSSRDRLADFISFHSSKATLKEKTPFKSKGRPAALNWIRDALAARAEGRDHELLKDPWVARDDYIAVILDRSPENVEQFLSRHATHELSPEEETTALKLLELQRNAMLMFASCGWFFDELSGIETVQIIQYAGRAVQLAQEIFGDSIEARFLKLLEQAKSNIPDNRDGMLIYEKFVKPATVDLAKVGAHYAVSSLFETYPERAKVYCYTADREDCQSQEAGRTKLATGRVRITSDITRESAVLSFAVLHLGDHNLSGGVREFLGQEAYQSLVDELTSVFSQADFPEVIRFLDKNFKASTYSLRSLFRDEQRNVLDRILESSLSGANAVYRQLYEQQAPMMRFLISMEVPVPKAFSIAAEFFLNTDLHIAFENEPLDVEHMKSLVQEASALRVPLDSEGLGYLFSKKLEAMMTRFESAPEDVSLLSSLDASAALARSTPFTTNLWKVQNSYFRLLETAYPGYRKKAKLGDDAASQWAKLFTSLGEKLSIRPG